MTRLYFILSFVFVLGFVVSCGSSSSASGGDDATIEPATATAIPPTATPAPPPPTPTPVIVRRDIFASHLNIPSLNIDANVQPSESVPYVDNPLPGCPADTTDTTTLVVPTSGIATPAKAEDGLENKAWIFGHSRYANVPQLFFALQNINVGDEVFVDGTDRQTQEKLTHQRFVVSKIYLADSDSGGKLLGADTPDQIPHMPQVILQTSVREDGAGKQWLLDRAKLTAKATNVIQGNVDDPCKYLLLFVIADSAG